MSYKYDFVKHRKIYFMISAVMVILGIITLFTIGLNTGIDFKSGTRYEINIGKDFKEAEIRELLNQAEETAKQQGIEVDLNPTIVEVAGTQNEIAVIRFEQTIQPEVKPIVTKVFQAKYGQTIGDINESTVNPTIGRELARKAIYSVLWAALGIILYVTIRFEYRFAIAAIVALLHDAFFVITIFSVFRTEVDLTFIAAILTIVGYSINDTIVIFDRIRENMKHAKIKRFEDVAEVVNISLNQTLVRSINTVLTVLITAFALYIFGGAGIKNFSFALLLGLFSGTYSSIFIASQIWLVWKGKSMKKERLTAQQAAK